MRRRIGTALLTVVVLAAVGPAGAAPDEDGQPSTAPSRYDATAPTGWMTSAAADKVHDLAQIGDTVYVAGSFQGIRPTRTGPVTARAWLAAFDAVTGAPRSGFTPVLDGPVYSLEVAPDGSRLYVGGAFSTANGTARGRIAALHPGTGAPLGGFVPDIGGGHVRSIVLRGSTLYAGGNFAWASGQARDRLAALDTATGQPVGDWQPRGAGGTVYTLEASPDGSRLYAGGTFTSVDGLPATAHLVALRRADGTVDPAFTAQPGREVFDVLADDRGLVWTALGGALGRADVYRAADGSLLTRHETAGDVETVEEIGDLIYFGGHDIGLTEDEHVGVVDPAAPAILETGPFDEPTTGGDGTWALHSTGTDLWVGGNVSSPYYGFARYPAVPDPPSRAELLPVLSSWRFLDTGPAPAGWRQPAFDDDAWPTGATEAGFGDSGEATELQSGRTTYYFRRTFDVADPAALTDLRLDLLADDGAAVFLNGTEVVRQNLPAGPLTDTTRAVDGLFGNAEDTFLSFAVPAGDLVAGTNTVAVEVHQNAAASSDLSFDLRLSAVSDTPPVPDTTPPTAPGRPVAGAVGETTVALSWPAASDDVAVDHYEVFQDGTLVASPATPDTIVGGLAPSTTYAFAVEAVDAAGNRSPRSPVATVTTADPPPGGPFEAVARGAAWRYRDDGWSGGDGSWRGLGFDDSSWRQGPAELGREDGDEATVVTGNWSITYHFRRTFSLAGVGSIRDLELELLADDGAVAYLNGEEVVRDNMPAGTVTAATNATDYRHGLGEGVWNTFTVNPGLLREGANVLAVEVHQAWGSSDLSFDARLAGTTGTTDTEPPSVPDRLSSPSRTDTTAELGWSPSTDDVGVARYDVFVDGAVATTSVGPNATLTGLSPSTTYTVEVEAVDGAGNRSGRSAPLEVTTAGGPGGPVTVVSRGTTWRYRNAGAAPPADWALPGFDDTGWLQGAAVLGREEGDEATVLTPGTGPRWFRRSFSVTDAGAATRVDLELVADDGAAVYLNGAEVVRDNLPAGPLGPTTLAAGYRTGLAERQVRSFTLPPGALAEGPNVLAVVLYQAAGSPDASFDASLTVTGAATDTTAPSVPGALTATGVGATTIDLAWAPATDDVAVDRYEVFVDGALAASAAGPSTTVTGLAASTTYSVQVEAVDAAGNRSGRSGALPVTTAAPPAGPVELIARGATWRYLDTGVDPGPGWAQVGFADGAWPSGPAILGREEGDESTVVAFGRGTRWFRRAFTATAPAPSGELVVELLADDGAVVHLNGVELLRDNVGPGPVSAATPAVDYRFGNAERTWRTFRVPAAALVVGSNVLAVSLHQADGSTDASFDLRLATA